MSELRIFTAGSSDQLRQTADHDEIAHLLDEKGVRFEQWDAQLELADDASSEAILAGYAKDIERLKAEGGYQAVDVIHMHPEHPDREALRRKFLDEHTHSEDEVRFFVAGRGLFSLHLGDLVYEVLCERGDLISVPANTPHWFDMGPAPRFTAIRIFTNPEGWVANFTGSDIASHHNRLEA